MTCLYTVRDHTGLVKATRVVILYVCGPGLIQKTYNFFVLPGQPPLITGRKRKLDPEY